MQRCLSQHCNTDIAKVNQLSSDSFTNDPPSYMKKNVLEQERGRRIVLREKSGYKPVHTVSSQLC